MEPWAVHRVTERRVAVLAKPNEGSGPGQEIFGIAWQVAPQNSAAFVRESARKGALDPHKSVVNELVDLRGAQHARCFLISRRHEKSSYRWGPAINAALNAARPGHFDLDQHAA